MGNKPCKTLKFAIVNISTTGNLVLIDGQYNGKQAIYEESSMVIEINITIKGINGQPRISFNESQPFIFIKNSYIKFQDLHFQGTSIAVSVKDSTVYLQSCLFVEVSFPVQLVCTSHCKLNVTNTKFVYPVQAISASGEGSVNIYLLRSVFLGRPLYSQLAITFGERFTSYLTESFNLTCFESRFEFFFSAIMLFTTGTTFANVLINKSEFRHIHIPQDVTFHTGSAISFQSLPLSKANTAELIVKDSTFYDNTGRYGGAISASSSGKFNFAISNSRFEKNGAILGGGGIDVLDQVKITITDTLFLNNVCFHSWFPEHSQQTLIAPEYAVGGAVSLRNFKPSYDDESTIIDRPEAIFRNCIFKGNGAEYSGGNIYSNYHSLTLENVSMRTSINASLASLQGDLITSKNYCTLKNATFEIEKAVDSRIAALFGNSVNALTLDRKSKFICPVGSKLKVRSLKLGPMYRNEFKMFAFYCVPCPLLFYSLNKSTLMDNKQNNVICQHCPPGGKCQEGVITARDNFWGILNSKTNLIVFFMLPNGYGCVGQQCQFYYSCAKNRKGTLCGECENGYSESMYSPRCIANRNCQIKKFWIIALVLVVFYILFFLYKEEIIFTLKTIVLSLRTPSLWYRKDEDSYHQDLLSNDRYILRNDTVDHIPENETRDEEFTKEQQDQNFFAGFLKVVFYFYQIEKLSRSYEHEIKDNVIQGLKTTISSFFNFHFLAGLGSVSCPSIHATPVTKVLTKALLLSVMFVVFALAYLINKGFHHIKRSLVKDSCIKRSEGVQFRERVLTVLFEAVLLSYALIAKTVFSLLTCVIVGNVNVLYIQGNIICYQSYQYAMIAIGFIWVLPFCFLIFLLPTSVHRRFIGKWSIFAACLFPLPFILYLVVKVGTGMKSDYEESMVQDNVCKAILKNLTGSFKCISKHSMHWEGFLLIRRLILVSAYSFIKDPIYKSYTIQVIQILILVHHVSIQPFRSKVLNVLETISLTILVMISGMNSFTIFVYTHGIHEEGDYLLLLKVFSWIREVAILIIPAVIGCIVVVLITVKILLLICSFVVFVVTKIFKKCWT